METKEVMYQGERVEVRDNSRAGTIEIYTIQDGWRYVDRSDVEDIPD